MPGASVHQLISWTVFGVLFALEPVHRAQTAFSEKSVAQWIAQTSVADPQSAAQPLPSQRPLPPSSSDEVTAGQMFRKATNDGNLQTIETLLSIGFDPNAPLDGPRCTPLWYAVESNQPDVVDLLLAAHADPNARGPLPPFYASPLELALQNGNIRIASRLIQAGAQVNAKGADGRTVLYYAVRERQLDAIHFLIESGAAVNVRDKDGTSPLDDAVRRGTLDTIALLLAHGAHLNEPETQAGMTPINEAACRGNVEIVKFLLQFHPDLGIPDKRGYGPLENALRFGRRDVALLLLDAQGQEPQSSQFSVKWMDLAIAKNEPRVVEALLRHGVAVNGTLPSGGSPLDTAAFAGFTNVVGVLLDHGADPNLASKTGATPLEDAALKGFDGIVSLLLDHGALVNNINQDSGATALYAAASFGKAGVVKLLLSRGANPNLCAKSKSPYQAALDSGYPDVAAGIKSHGGSGNCQQ